jgi:hypothetical protein
VTWDAKLRLLAERLDVEPLPPDHDDRGVVVFILPDGIGARGTQFSAVDLLLAMLDRLDTVE